ncbi:MAG: hypothetical protein ACJAUP_001371 [Cellvibrionaceae bacterium]|jgi:hypothetical protein
MTKDLDGCRLNHQLHTGCFADVLMLCPIMRTDFIRFGQIVNNVFTG